MNMNAVEQIIPIVSRISGIPKIAILDHISEPFNDTFFHFDAINMVYFVMILKKELGVTLNNQMLKNCAYWSILDFAQIIACDSQDEN